MKSCYCCDAEQMAPTDAQPIRQRARLGGDPVHMTKPGCHQWGNSGKEYCGSGSEKKAAKQGQAAYAAGYKK